MQPWFIICLAARAHCLRSPVTSTLGITIAMRHAYKLAIFYALVVLAAFNLHALVSRFMLEAPDPVAWHKVGFALFLQFIAVGVAVLYLQWLSRTDMSLFEASPSLFFLGLKTTPLVASGVLLAFSVTILYNSVNCGNHPLPSNRGMSTCPR
jgi:hypothetical protein